jgi:DNA-binding FadR family transcriptional regulator
LRERILNGEYADSLPKQETLMADFEVSAPSIREAFRVLEAEGLITVRRGNVGGAVVRLPNADDTAYALGLALQADGAKVADVAAALWHIEPSVARLCAERADRATQVVPQLEEALAVAEAIGDEDWEYKAQIFHDRMRELCGNRALNAVIASLYALYHSHLDEWQETHGSFASLELRREVIAEHRKLLRLIERGNGAAAAKAAGIHLQHLLTQLVDDDDTVTVLLPRRSRSRRRAAVAATDASA